MWHTAVYQSSVTNGLTDAADNALADGVFKIGSSNGFVLQEDMMPIAAWYAPINGTAARLKSPKFNQFGPLELIPVQAAAAAPVVVDGLLVATWIYRPPIFRNQEEVTCTVDTGGAAPALEPVAVSFSNGIDPVPPGEELTLKFTSTTAASTTAWTVLTLTAATTIPEGRYAMIGSECISSKGIAHRWTFWGQFYRPGFPSTSARTNRQYPGVRDFRHGLMGRFSNVTLPNLEVLCGAADASHTIFARCIKEA